MAALNLGWVTLRWENGKFRVHRYHKLRSRARLLHEHMPSVDRLLDLGSAEGHPLKIFRVMARHRFALDYRLSALQGMVVPDSERVAGDATCLPFRDAAFDCIVISEVLQHIVDHQGVVKEIQRVLAPGGPLLVTVPNTERLNLRLGWLGIQGEVNPDHVREYTMKGIRGLIEGAGFRVEKVSGDGLLCFGWPGRLFPGLATSIFVKAVKPPA